MVEEEEDIRESIGIILRTSRGERVMRPDFGTDIVEYLFSPAGADIEDSLASEVQEELLYQEPRIRDVDVMVRQPEGPEGTITVEVGYTVRSTNSRYNHVYPFYVTEGSEGGGGV
ncbi:MAG: GPW/gp25 family protein [Oscillospiraceae bacterium]|nr:GPW/gp25 family protein [Oscillospiraceae bacterium]